MQRPDRVRNACIILPTYNEAPNIITTLDRIFQQQRIHKRTGIRLQVLVVDDNSPDGTAQLVRSYRQKNNHVHLLLREEKNGLGAAYIAGMQHALRVLHPDVIMEMDADGQHKPADIFRLLTAVGDDADFVIGSRYIAGGSLPATWGAHRKAISRAANLYTMLILDTGGAKDCTAGFRAIRSSALQKVDFGQLQVKGYAFQVTLLDACVRGGAKVKEVPISFLERKKGGSKMRLQDMVLGALMIARIRLRRMFRIRPQNHQIPTTTPKVGRAAVH